MCSIIADFTAAMMEPVEITEPAKHDGRYQRCTYLISTLKKRPSECNESKYCKQNGGSFGVSMIGY